MAPCRPELSRYRCSHGGMRVRVGQRARARSYVLALLVCGGAAASSFLPSFPLLSLSSLSAPPSLSLSRGSFVPCRSSEAVEGSAVAVGCCALSRWSPLSILLRPLRQQLFSRREGDGRVFLLARRTNTKTTSEPKGCGHKSDDQ